MTLFDDLQTYFDSYMGHLIDVNSAWANLQAEINGFSYQTGFTDQAAYTVYAAALAAHEVALASLETTYNAKMTLLDGDRGDILDSLPDDALYFKLEYDGSYYGLAKTADNEIIIVTWNILAGVAAAATASAPTPTVSIT
jgi:hypothetical protein